MSEIAINTDLEITATFEKAGEGSLVSDACMQEIVDRLRVAVKNPESVGAGVQIADDADNILTKNTAGQLRVQRDTYHVESQDVPVPPSTVDGTGVYAVPVTRFRITAVIMADGSIEEIPEQGQVDLDAPVYPEDVETLAGNLNDETAPFEWGVDGGVLTVKSDLGKEIAAVIEGGENPTDSLKKIDAEEIEGGVPGDSDVIFKEAARTDLVDYSSVFMVSLEVLPGDGFDKAYIVSKKSSEVKVKIEGVRKVLTASLRVFQPAQKEEASEF